MEFSDRAVYGSLGSGGSLTDFTELRRGVALTRGRISGRRTIAPCDAIDPPRSALQISFARRGHLRLVFENDDELLDLAASLLDGEGFGLLNPLIGLKLLRRLQRLACLPVSLP
jgi:hypothetical protein